MDNIVLCFCIPTYNRAQSVSRLVMDILSCNDKYIKVVVLDNGSTDDTLSILHKISDNRLLVFSNRENKGALYNMINVINKGIGDYIVYSTDKDHVSSDKITEFRIFLSSKKFLACGYCKLNSKSNIKYELFDSGYEAIKKIAYKGYHPTGYFFNNNML